MRHILNDERQSGRAKSARPKGLRRICLPALSRQLDDRLTSSTLPLLAEQPNALRSAAHVLAFD